MVLSLRSKSGANGTSPRVPLAPKGFLSGTRLRVPRRQQATSYKDACASSLLDDFYSDLRVRRVREHPPNVWPTWDLRGKQPSPALVMIVASRGPGASAPAAGWRPRQGERCRRPGSTHRKLRLAGRWYLTPFVRFLANLETRFTHGRGHREADRREPTRTDARLTQTGPNPASTVQPGRS